LIAWHLRSASTTARNVRFHSSCVSICGGVKGVFWAHPPTSGHVGVCEEGTQTIPWKSLVESVASERLSAASASVTTSAVTW
jgi:hypothetical protein